jgi:trehalose 6-phosphate phosphatase
VALPSARTRDGQAGLDAILADPDGALIASDFDGTLSPIVEDPADARACPGAADALSRLGPAVGTLAIITGRSAADAVTLGGLAEVPGLIVLGHYGAERWQGGRVTATAVPEGVDKARLLLASVLASAGAPDGTRIEDKGTALAVHTRRAADPAGALAALRDPLADLSMRTGLALEPGRFVLELRPAAIDKGAALRGLATERGSRCVLFCGDDLGDLSAFAEIRAQRAAGTWRGCAVASASPEVPEVAEAADLVVDGPAGVVALLAALAGSLRVAS